MYPLVVTILVLSALFLILVVLLQSGKGGDIGSAFGGGGTQTVFGPRGSGNVMTKATTIAAVVFMASTIATVLLSQSSSRLGGLAEAEESTPSVEETAPPSDIDIPAAGEATTEGGEGDGDAGEAGQSDESGS